MDCRLVRVVWTSLGDHIRAVENGPVGLTKNSEERTEESLKGRVFTGRVCRRRSRDPRYIPSLRSAS